MLLTIGRPSTHRSRSRGAVLLSSLMLIVGLGWTAMSGTRVLAATGPAQPEPPANERFALTPTGTDPTQPGSRTSFSFAVAAGASAADRVTLFNYADHATAFQLYANDALDTAEGQLDLKRSDQKPTDAGQWVKLEQGALVVPANSAAVVPFVVVVPPGAAPGDHAAGIIASIKGSATTPTGQRVAVEDRVGVPLYVRVSGTLRPMLAVQDVQAHYQRSAFSVGSGTMVITYRVVNLGNVRLAAHQHLEVDGPFGWVLAQRPGKDLPELLPGASISGRARFTGVLPAVRVTGLVRLHPYSKQGRVDPPPPVASGSSSVWAIPWLLVVILVLLIGLGNEWRRRRRRRRPPPPAPPARQLEPSASAPGSGP